jgi:hypothetical protein
MTFSKNIVMTGQLILIRKLNKVCIVFINFYVKHKFLKRKNIKY